MGDGIKMKKVYLHIYDIVLCEISGDDKLEIVNYEDNIKVAKQEYPLQMRLFKKSLSGILSPIENIINCLDREDIKKQANIEENDSLFEKLFKVAGIELIDYNGFNIFRK